MTVFILQNQMQRDWDTNELRPKFDFEPAREYGELVYLLSPTASPFNSAPLVEELQRKLACYDGELDYLLLVGNPVLIGLTVAIAARVSPRLQMLQYSGRQKRYISVSARLTL